MASGSALREQIFANDPAHPIVLDLRDVEFCDSTGVSVFVAAKLHTEAAGGELVRRNPSRWVRRVLEVAGTLGVFTIEDPRLTPRARALSVARSPVRGGLRDL